MRLDIARNLDSGISIPPASITTTQTGDAISLVGKGSSIMGVIMIGAIAAADATNFITFTVTQCKTSGGTYTPADSGQYDWVEGDDALINATAEADSIKTFNFRPKADYDYVKIVGTVTLTVEVIYGATFLKPGRHNPVAT